MAEGDEFFNGTLIHVQWPNFASSLYHDLLRHQGLFVYCDQVTYDITPKQSLIQVAVPFITISPFLTSRYIYFQ